MSQKFLKAGAVIFLLLAMGALAWAFHASNQRVHIQGPSAVAVLADQSVWLSVDDALWHLDASGRRITQVNAKTLAVGGLIGNLVVHPNGQLVASVRDDPTLYFLDPQTALIRARLLPQWPADLAGHGSRAITYAFHADGRIAISTGGGHAVAVFGADGRYLGRSAPGLYQFTNGLWWAESSLWTTDTNGMSLIELDAQTLALKHRVVLTQNLGAHKYLGMAVASRGQPAVAGQALPVAPLATLVRFANGMVVGQAADVLPDGTQHNFPITRSTEPRDIKWRGDELLLVDGASYAIQRYGADRQALPDFGDAKVRAELSGLHKRRASLQRQYLAGLAGAVLLFVLGFAAAWRAQQQEDEATLEALEIDLSQLGTPRLSPAALLRERLLFARLPLVVCSVVSMLLYGLTLNPLGLDAKGVDFAGLAIMLALTASVIWLSIRLRRAMADPTYEALFNFRAVQILATHPAFWQRRQPGELPRETLMLSSATGGQQWLVLTNQRLLVFAVSRNDSRLVAEYARRAIARLRLPQPHELPWWERLLARVNLGTALSFEFKDGSALAATTQAVPTARRMAQLLRPAAFDAPSANEMAQTLRAQARPPAPRAAPHIAPHDAQAAVWQALASFLVPGLGQRIQGRKGTALHMFMGWLLALFALVAVIWVLWAPRAAVPLRYGLFVAVVYLSVCSVAAIDAWRMRRQRT